MGMGLATAGEAEKDEFGVGVTVDMIAPLEEDVNEEAAPMEPAMGSEEVSPGGGTPVPARRVSGGEVAEFLTGVMPTEVFAVGGGDTSLECVGGVDSAGDVNELAELA